MEPKSPPSNDQVVPDGSSFNPSESPIVVELESAPTGHVIPNDSPLRRSEISPVLDLNSTPIADEVPNDSPRGSFGRPSGLEFRSQMVQLPNGSSYQPSELSNFAEFNSAPTDHNPNGNALRPFQASNVVANENASPAFPCKYCGKIFPNFQSLGGHQNAHKHERLLTKQRKLIEGSGYPRASFDQFTSSGVQQRPRSLSAQPLGVRDGSAIHKPYHSSPTLVGSRVLTGFARPDRYAHRPMLSNNASLIDTSSSIRPMEIPSRPNNGIGASAVISINDLPKPNETEVGGIRLWDGREPEPRREEAEEELDLTLKL